MPETFDAEKAIKSIKQFITEKLLNSGLNGYVIGLSGGIDSSLSATLAVEAVGCQKVLGILMPYKLSTESSVIDALELIEKLRIEYRKIDISPMIDIYFDKIDESNRIRAGNKMARERMAILFDIAYEMNRLVLGTGNRTEICLGYTTWYGDAACSVNPLGELYKTEIRQLAKILGVPDNIINKPPTADLWAGQTDEGEIGVSYNLIDNLLKQLLDNNNRSLSKLEKDGFKKADITRVVSLINNNSFKRRLPDIASLGRVTVPESVQLEI